MTTRRTLLIAVGNALLGAGIVTRATFNSSTEPSSDMRVVTSKDCPKPGLRLKPARDDEAYVVTDPNGYVQEIDIAGLNQTAKTRFENLVLVCNEGGTAIEELYFELEVVDQGLTGTDPTPADIEETLFIASAGGSVPGDGSVEFMGATTHGQLGDGRIDAGEELPFGIGVDLLPSNSPIQDLPDPAKFGVNLIVDAVAANVPGCGSGGPGPGPGAGPPACPLSPSVTVDVAAGADPERVQSSDITVQNEDIDGEVRTTAGSGGDIDIKKADIAGAVTADGEIGTLQDAAVGGDVTAQGGDIGGAVKRSEIDGDVRTASGSGGDIDIKDATITGAVTADGEVGTLQDATIGGDVTANGDIGDAVKRSKIGGDLVSTTDGDIDVQDSTVCGTVESSGAIGKLKDSSIGGGVTANGDIDANNSTVYGNLNPLQNSDGDVHIINGTVIKGDITANGANGDITITQSTVEGTVYADGDVEIKAGSTVEGDVDTDGDVTVNGTVEGGVFTSGAVDGNGTIQGNDPR